MKCYKHIIHIFVMLSFTYFLNFLINNANLEIYSLLSAKYFIFAEAFYFYFW